MGYFEAFVGVNFWTALFVLLNTLTIFFVAKKFLFKPIMKIIADRQKEIDDMYSDAESSRKDAEAMKSEYQEKLNTATEESEKILKDAQRKAQLREEEIILRANAEAQKTLERAEAQIELEKKNAINQVKNEVTEVAISIASAVIERDVKADEHKELIDDFISSMGDEK